MVESAWIAFGAAVVGVVGTATVGILGYVISRKTNRETLAAAKVSTDESIAAAREANKAAIEAAHADAREGQLTDRYTKAVEQLGSDNQDVRIGGIYALERIACDSARDYSTVMEVLSAFIREHSREQWPRDLGSHHWTRPDVQAAFTVVGRRDTKRDIRPIDLYAANLIRTDLNGKDLSGAILSQATFECTGLRGAILSNVRLNEATIKDAYLEGAVLRNAIIRDSTLTGVDLRGADLRGADLRGTRVTGADLTGAWWSEGTPVPAGWKLDSDGRLERAGSDSGPATAGPHSSNR